MGQFWIGGNTHPVNPVLALWLIAIPVLDCLVLILRRAREGRSPFAAGRDHIHHLMRDAGFSAAGLTLVLAAFSLVAGLCVGQAMRLDLPNPLLLAAFGALCVAWYWLSADRNRALAALAMLRPRRPSDTPSEAEALEHQPHPDTGSNGQVSRTMAARAIEGRPARPYASDSRMARTRHQAPARRKDTRL